MCGEQISGSGLGAQGVCAIEMALQNNADNIPHVLDVCAQAEGMRTVVHKGSAVGGGNWGTAWAVE